MKSLPITVPLFARLEIAFGEWLSALGYAETTVYSAPLYAREFMAYAETLGLASLAGVNASVAAVHLGRVAARPNRTRGGGLSVAYVAKHRQALRLFSRYLTESGQGGFGVPAQARREAREERHPAVLTQDETTALYEACDDDDLGLRDRAMLALFYGCGLRRTEGVRLDVADVLLDRGAVHVRHGKNYRERYVPLAAGVVRDLACYLSDARPGLRSRGETAVLVSQRGGRITGQSLLLRLQALQARAAFLDVPALGEKAVGLHTLRHSVATHLLLSGMALEEIARFMGHRSLESTQIYTHLAHEVEAGSRGAVVHAVEDDDFGPWNDDERDTASAIR